MAQSTAERQKALRERRALLGLAEVRGIYLPPELHAKLKALASDLLAKHKPPTSPPSVR